MKSVLFTKLSNVHVDTSLFVHVLNGNWFVFQLIPLMPNPANNSLNVIMQSWNVNIKSVIDSDENLP